MRIAICENNAAGATQLCGWIEQYCKLYRIPADLECFLSPMAFSSHEGHFNIVYLCFGGNFSAMSSATSSWASKITAAPVFRRRLTWESNSGSWR